MDVKVTRQLSFDNIAENTQTNTPINVQTSCQCAHSSDIADIKKLLISLSARMDIMESKVKRLEGK